MRYQTGKRRILILGGGYAGLMAAARASRAGDLAEVTLIDARPSFVQRIRLHEALAGSAPKGLEYARLLPRRGVRFVQGFVEGVDAGRQRVLGRDAGGGRIDLGYDELVIALGSATAAGAPGVAEHAVRLNSPVEAAKGYARIRDLAGSGGRVLMVGGGLTGIESATELAERFPALRVILAARDRVGEGYSARGGAHLRRRMGELGIELVEGVAVEAVEPGRAWLQGGGEIPFDLCVWAGGFEAPRLGRDAGFAVDRAGRILVDAALRVPGHPNVLAVGDSAAATGFWGGPIRMGCVSALPMGAYAGDSLRRRLRGEEIEPFGFGFVVRCISLGRKDGLVQSVALDDAPREKVLTRGLASLTKELICRMTYWVTGGELWSGMPLYKWPRPESPALAIARPAAEGPR